MTLHRKNARRDRNERLIVEYLKRAGALVQRISAAGVPDLLIGYRGRWALFEVKGARGTLTPQQTLFHDAAGALKLPCFVVRDVADCQAKLRSLANGNQ